MTTSRKSSDYPIFARAFRIDGKEYSSLKQFADEFEKKVQATAAYYSKTEAGNTQKPSSATLSATNERVKSNEKTFQSDPSDTRDDEKNRIKNQIAALYVELASQKGLFAGIRRKKIQAQIDELQEKLASIKKNIG